MLQFIFQKLMDYYPTVSVYSLIILISGFVIWKLAWFYYKTSDTNSLVPKILSSLDRLETGLDKLNHVLVEKGIIDLPCYARQKSPWEINEVGEKLLQKSGADKLLEIIKDRLLLDLENKPLISLLELQRESLNVLVNYMDDIEFKDVQNFVYQNPTFENNPLRYIDLIHTMSLRLRNYYLEKHPNHNLG